VSADGKGPNLSSHYFSVKAKSKILASLRYTMNNFYNTILHHQNHQTNKSYYGYSDNKMGMALPQESLFSMAMYDQMVEPVTHKHHEHVPARNNSVGFHPVEECKDLSLRELLDLTDDFLFDEEMDSNMNNLNPTPLPTGSMMPLNPGLHRYVANNSHHIGSYSEPAPLPLTQDNLMPNSVVSMSMTMDSNMKRRRSISVEDSDDIDGDCSDDDLNGDGRFRPYQAGQWAERFDDLCKYREQTGNCLVPHTYKDNLPLARWVKRQRYQYKLMKEEKASTMTPERVQSLEDIGFVWDSQGAAWGERLEELREFRKIYMHCNVPSNFSENPQLATWVKCQRRQYKLHSEGKPSNMTSERIDELESIGFEWLLRSYKKARFE
jgi:hypothetical protein